MFVRPVAALDYRLWVDGKVVSSGPIAAFRANVIDLAAEPAMWGGRGVNHVHFHIRRAAIDDAAADLGYERIDGVRLSVAVEDVVLAQLTKSILPILGATAPRGRRAAWFPAGSPPGSGGGRRSSCARTSTEPFASPTSRRRASCLPATSHAPSKRASV
jgi:hypothetical protein